MTHEPEVISLLDADYAFKDSPPKFIRATLFHYYYTSANGTSGDDDGGGGGGGNDDSGDYWRRERIGSFFPVVDAEDPGLVNYLKNAGILSSSSSPSPASSTSSPLQTLIKVIRLLLSPLGGFQLCAFSFLIGVIGGRQNRD